MEAAKFAFGTGNGKNPTHYPVFEAQSATIASTKSAGQSAALVSKWNAKGLDYPFLGLNSGIGQGVCHSFTHYGLEVMGVTSS